jgi:hypothetical protein
MIRLIFDPSPRKTTVRLGWEPARRTLRAATPIALVWNDRLQTRPRRLRLITRRPGLVTRSAPFHPSRES